MILSLHLLGSEYYLLISSEQRNQYTWKALYSPVWYFQTSDICEYKILCKLCQLCVPVLLFLCHFTLVYRRWAKKPKRKMWRKLCLFHQPGQGWLVFFVKETFWLNIKNISYISSFHPWTPRSSLQFSLLSTTQFL